MCFKFIMFIVKYNWLNLLLIQNLKSSYLETIRIVEKTGFHKRSWSNFKSLLTNFQVQKKISSQDIKKLIKILFSKISRYTTNYTSFKKVLIKSKSRKYKFTSLLIKSTKL